DGEQDRFGGIAEPSALDQQGEGVAEAEAQTHARGAADKTDQHRLDEELPHDVAAAGTDGHTDADLLGAFGDADQHDVHHPDATHYQRDHGDGGNQQRQRGRGRLDGVANGGGVLQEEVG